MGLRRFVSREDVVGIIAGARRVIIEDSSTNTDVTALVLAQCIAELGPVSDAALHKALHEAIRADRTELKDRLFLSIYNFAKK